MQPKGSEADLLLDGEDLDLQHISIDGRELVPDVDYKVWYMSLCACIFIRGLNSRTTTRQCSVL